MALEIRTFPDPFLQKKARKIKKITPRHHQLAREMVQTMRSHDGVGLAANQNRNCLRSGRASFDRSDRVRTRDLRSELRTGQPAFHGHLVDGRWRC